MAKNIGTAEAFGYTNVKVVKFKYTWTINNFRFCCYEGGDALLSPRFSTDGDNSLKWRLQIHQYKDSVSYVQWLRVDLISCSNDSKKSWNIECKISICINGKNCVVQRNVRNGILLKTSSSNSQFFSFFPLIEMNNLLKHLEAVTLNQTISLICEICTSSENENFSSPIRIPEAVSPNPLELLFENPQFSDVTFSANGTDFKVHKAILATQSQVFEAMFNANMKENVSNRVEIADLNEVTLREILRFIYTGKVLNLQDIAKDLLRAADKYALQTLKDLCGTELNRQLSITNALSIFTLADMHSATQLRSYVKNFIRIHLLDVVNTSEWKIMVQEHPKLTEDILITP